MSYVIVCLMVRAENVYQDGLVVESSWKNWGPKFPALSQTISTPNTASEKDSTPRSASSTVYDIPLSFPVQERYQASRAKSQKRFVLDGNGIRQCRVCKRRSVSVVACSNVAS